MKINWRRLKSKDLSYLHSLKIEDLITILKEADQAYYNTSNTIISDDVYDFIKDYCQGENPRHVYFKKIGAPVPKALRVKLPHYLSSLDKIKPGEKSFDKFVDQYPGPYVVADKLDGISLLLFENNGRWVLYTRGDGRYGMDVSRLLPYMKLPSVKPGLAVRGEFIISKSLFQSNFSSDKKNARNFVGGLVTALKQVNRSALRQTKFIAHELISSKVKPSVQLRKLKAMGFQTVPFKVFDSLDDASLTTYLQHRKNSSKFEMDGLVVIQDKPHPRISSGNPPYAKAFKVLDESSTAKVKVIEVEWNESRHGFLMPRIEIEKVKLRGVTISHLTGFNAKYIQDNNIGPGTLLKIVRSGDVIPHILQVIKSTKAQMPEVDYQWTDSKVNIFSSHRGQLTKIKRINHFFRVLEVDYFSIGLVSRFFNHGLNSIKKIISADVDQLIKIEGIQHKIASKILNNIKKSLTDVPLPKLMYASSAFGRDLGFVRLKSIVEFLKEHNLLNNILKGNYSAKTLYDLLLSVSGISEKLATSFIDGLPKFLKFKNSLPENSYSLKSVDKRKKITNNRFENKTIVFTGFRDNNLQQLIENEGGKVTTSLSKKTDLLVFKEDGKKSTKIDQAEQLGIKIISLTKFKQMIEG